MGCFLCLVGWLLDGGVVEDDYGFLLFVVGVEVDVLVVCIW